MAKVSKPEKLDFEVLPPTGASTEAKTTHDGPDPLIWLVSRLLDTVFRIPGTRIRFGLEPIIGLIPVLGDQAATLISAALLFRSLQHRLPKIALVRMGLNVALNGLIGAIPILGDAFVLWYKPNVRNYRILQRYAGQAKASTRLDWFFVFAIVAVTLFLITTLSAFVAYAVLRSLQKPF